MPRLSMTTAPLNLLYGKSYYDLIATLDSMKDLKARSVIDGFELQDLAEWDERGPPRDVRTKGHRIGVWEECRKFDTAAKIDLCLNSSIISIHANRDVGIFLCSEHEDDVVHGRHLLRETLEFASNLGSSIVVFHLWDTYSQDFDPRTLRAELREASSGFPNIIASVENVPTHLDGSTPFDLAKMFDHVTLDTRWAGMYDELESFQDILGKIVNVHLRCSLEGDAWALHNAPYSFDEALHIIHGEWGYSHLFTLEPERSKVHPTLDGMTTAIASLKTMLSQNQS